MKFTPLELTGDFEILSSKKKIPWLQRDSNLRPLANTSERLLHELYIRGQPRAGHSVERWLAFARGGEFEPRWSQGKTFFSISRWNFQDSSWARIRLLVFRIDKNYVISEHLTSYGTKGLNKWLAPTERYSCGGSMFSTKIQRICRK